MQGADGVWDEQFPRLFRDNFVDYAQCWIRYTTERLPEELVSRLHLVALTPDSKVVVCRSAEGWRFLPGGTREARESLVDLARRELEEEAGAALEGDLHCFAAHVADSQREHPYRPHLPHPRTVWAYAVADVRVIGAPTNPPDGEVVVEVVTLPAEQAADYLEAHDPLQADVLRHARAMGLLEPRR